MLRGHEGSRFTLLSRPVASFYPNHARVTHSQLPPKSRHVSRVKLVYPNRLSARSPSPRVQPKCREIESSQTTDGRSVDVCFRKIARGKMADVIADIEAKIAVLNLRLPELEGKANKRERTAVSKEVYALENDEAYVAALKERAAGSRAAAAAADDDAHAAKLAAEAAAEAEAAEAAAQRRAAAAQAGPAQDADDSVSHMQVTSLKKGGGGDKPVAGDKVGVTYVGTFAEGVTHGGVDYAGKEFDSTLRSGRQAGGKKGSQAHVPLTFRVGENKAIRGWEEVVKTMTLGEKVEVVIGPKWAYRKAGIVDDAGKIVVPPNASLRFVMRLVQINGDEHKGDMF